MFLRVNHKFIPEKESFFNLTTMFGFRRIHLTSTELHAPSPALPARYAPGMIHVLCFHAGILSQHVHSYRSSSLIDTLSVI